MMANVCDISEEVLQKSIREIIESADLNVMTAKLVRNELKTKLNVQDLDSQKRRINDIIDNVINGLSKRDDKNNVKDNDSVKKAKTGSNKKLDNDSDDSSCDEDKKLSDEGLARKLHNQELDSKRRVTRNVNNTRKKTKKTVKSTDDKPKRKSNNGFTKPCVLSSELADFFGTEEMPRHEVVKRIWSYVKENNLYDPKNKQFAICDNPLIKIFGRKRFRMFGMMKILAKHLN